VTRLQNEVLTLIQLGINFFCSVEFVCNENIFKIYHFFIVMVGESFLIEFNARDDQAELGFIVFANSDVGLFSDSWGVIGDCVMFTPAIGTSVGWLVVISEENEVHGGAILKGIKMIIPKEVLLLSSDISVSIDV
jgi:hypothetical protein